MIFKLIPVTSSRQRIEGLHRQFSNPTLGEEFTDLYGNVGLRALLPKGSTSFEVRFVTVYSSAVQGNAAIHRRNLRSILYTEGTGKVRELESSAFFDLSTYVHVQLAFERRCPLSTRLLLTLGCCCFGLGLF